MEFPFPQQVVDAIHQMIGDSSQDVASQTLRVNVVELRCVDKRGARPVLSAATRGALLPRGAAKRFSAHKPLMSRSMLKSAPMRLTASSSLASRDSS
jgi:hypothetical protein